MEDIENEKNVWSYPENRNAKLIAALNLFHLVSFSCASNSTNTEDEMCFNGFNARLRKAFTEIDLETLRTLTFNQIIYELVSNKLRYTSCWTWAHFVHVKRIVLVLQFRNSDLALWNCSFCDLRRYFQRKMRSRIFIWIAVSTNW